jgi:hypothetical protein
MGNHYVLMTRVVLVLLCRVRRKDDDLKAGVGGQRGMGIHTRWVKDKEAQADSSTPSEAASSAEHLVQSWRECRSLVTRNISLRALNSLARDLTHRQTLACLPDIFRNGTSF